MNCEMFTNLMGDYRDDDLDAKTRLSFDGHRSVCSDCSALYHSYSEAIRMTRSLSCGDIPSEALSRIRGNLKTKFLVYQ